MSPKVIVSMLIAFATPAMLHAAEPENRALMKQCQSAKGEVAEECRKVAKEMIKNRDSTEERTDMTSQDVTHSSPAMEPDAKPAKPTPPKQADKKAPQVKDPK